MAARQVFVGFTTEGTTDVRFLEKIIERSFEEIAYECQGDVEPVVWPLVVDKTVSICSEMIRIPHIGKLSFIVFI